MLELKEQFYATQLEFYTNPRGSSSGLEPHLLIGGFDLKSLGATAHSVSQ